MEPKYCILYATDKLFGQNTEAGELNGSQPSIEGDVPIRNGNILIHLTISGLNLSLFQLNLGALKSNIS